ncbi:MAG: hypothetical protein Q4F53_04750 [Nesterenkonia sp.]|uniref:hypothetical protein n=1 Tax=Nesterenkonia marinintestina TaxID=2979865 RepID=UPI0021BE02E0|nr:hypothetical protein [Nesterenkonia sp. GX14115]MDO5492901.1 hypothetical protein [Nesterenkonia sp.]
MTAEMPEPLMPPASSEIRDTPAEVDAVFRTVRRVSGTYFLLFLLLVASIPVLANTLDWWTEARLFGFSPDFLVVAIGLYAAFTVIGILAATLTTSVESRMLGGGTGDTAVAAFFDADEPPADVFGEDVGRPVEDAR